MSSMPLTCCVCNEPMHRSRSSKPQGEAAHNKCRKTAIVSHGEGGYRKGCRCEVCRAAKNERMRRYAANRLARDGIGYASQIKRKRRGVDPLATVDCFLCKEPLVNIRTNQSRYPLHKKCRSIAPEWVRRQRDNPRRADFQAKIDRAAQGTDGGKRVWTSGPCGWCGKQFVGIGFTCSQKCRKNRAYTLRSTNTFKVSPKRREAIYERDGWACQICALPVDNTVNYLDDWYPTLDHIVPQSHMLIPDHSEENLRTVHRFCNSLRGDNSHITDEGVVIRSLERWQSRQMEVAA